MHDIKLIRDNPTAFDAGLARRFLPKIADEILQLDREKRHAQALAEKLLAERNHLSQLVGKLKSQNQSADTEMARVQTIKAEIEGLEAKQDHFEQIITQKLAVIPNIPADEVPVGKDEHDNVEIRKWGQVKEYHYKPLRHFELGEALDQMDFTTAANISGARFVILRRDLARLERAIANFMLDTHTTEHGYQETTTPHLVRSDTVYGTGQLPKFAEDLFHTIDDFWLIPTAEVPLTAQAMGMVYDGEKLPLRFTAHTPCYRSEAGAAGKDTRGMIRQHQFYKVELVTLCRNDQSVAEHEHMTESAENILKKLELPYRTIVLCTGDMGFGARKTYDIEVWLPGEAKYREISSCSNVWDFQARRLNGRYKTAGEKGTKFLHTLNGSGLAVGRCLVAILENYQQADGSIAIPERLRPYMMGADKIPAHRP